MDLIEPYLVLLNPRWGERWLDDLVLVDDLLKLVLQEVVERLDVMERKPVLTVESSCKSFETFHAIASGAHPAVQVL